ncbi:hypothetical protein GOP47_0004773 [Adiantum capillus-veneris]|uniref:YbaK/aminoacyl-tRNA synthetase-associated domain-containing protein n=1 Tax=Adiantum capillus-veneris TaxID=13818 RepID=A0A9D4V4A3_ADICA|nr:hypothetical protein GOP47_0004773 [Adiantum capillus-veneris]
MAAVSKEALLSHLKGLGISLRLHEHPAVMTVDEQAKHLGHLEVTLSKNLFLKDKKGRLYLVSALAPTNVDLKALSQRLGLGKGGLRMAPEDALQEVLKVPLGSVTPLALINPSARSVILLLDHRYRNQAKLLFHPLVNDSTLEMTNPDFDMFLQSIDREPSYVDFEAVVTVGKDQPPDLAGFVMESTIKPVTPDNKQSTAVIQNSSSTQAEMGSANFPASKSKVTKSERPADEGGLQKLVGDPQRLLSHILDETIRATLTKVIKDSRDKESEASISNEIKSQITPDLESIMVLFKNTAYTQGFCAGRRR